MVSIDEQKVHFARQQGGDHTEDMPEIPVVAAGSLLELALNKARFSMPVGRITYFLPGTHVVF